MPVFFWGSSNADSFHNSRCRTIVADDGKQRQGLRLYIACDAKCWPAGHDAERRSLSVRSIAPARWRSMLTTTCAAGVTCAACHAERQYHHLHCMRCKRKREARWAHRKNTPAERTQRSPRTLAKYAADRLRLQGRHRRRAMPAIVPPPIERHPFSYCAN